MQLNTINVNGVFFIKPAIKLDKNEKPYLLSVLPVNLRTRLPWKSAYLLSARPKRTAVHLSRKRSRGKPQAFPDYLCIFSLGCRFIRFG